jgi:hypothetical protein
MQFTSKIRARLLPQYGDNRRRLTERWITLFALDLSANAHRGAGMKGCLPLSYPTRNLGRQFPPKFRPEVERGVRREIRVAAAAVAADWQLM